MNDINFILRPTLLKKLSLLFQKECSEHELMEELRKNYELKSY